MRHLASAVQTDEGATLRSSTGNQTGELGLFSDSLLSGLRSRLALLLRTRLIGLGALSGAVGSDVLFTANFVQQAAVIVPALLDNMKGNRVTMDFLRTKSKKASDGTPTFAEFAIKKRPAHMRRAPSISEHVDGEKGPSSEDVASAAVGTFQGLMRHGDATQVQATLAPVLAWLDGRDTSGSLPTPSRSQWDNVEWCSWLAETMASWAALQYRFVVLTALVEHLVDTCEGPGLGKHATLVAMVTTILMGQTSLIGLSTSDTLNNLLGLIVRRVHIDSRDSLLPPLVECVSGLGVHVYYADQINDIADEITARIVALQVPESSSQSSASASQVAKAVAKSTPEQRDESIRVLLVCLSGVMAAAKRSSGEVQKAVDEGTSMATVEKGKATAAEGDATLGLARAGTRNRISSEVWHHTASLLAHPNHTVRLAYEQALLTFLVDEVDRGSVATDLISAGVGPSLSNDATGLTHAFSAGAHVLALSKNLAVHTSVRESPLEVLPSIDRANAEESIAAPSDLSSAALPVDYSGLSALFDALYESLPVPALLGTVPMLLALDRNAGKQLLPAAKDRGSADAQRRLATRAVVAKAFIKIADVWNVPALRSVAENVSGSCER